MDAVLATLAVIMPPVLAIAIRSRTRAVLYGTLIVWVVMIAGTQHNLATDPDYNSVAPSVSIVGGWIPGLMYSGLCVSVVAVASMIWNRNTNEPRQP